MKKLTLFLLISISAFCIDASGQGLPPGECGILFTYDATGSLVKREYVCNNTPAAMERIGQQAALGATVEEESLKPGTSEVPGVSAIMPNPTTGRFSVRLARPLNNVRVLLLTGNGSVIERRKVSGNRISFDISGQAAGTYYVHIIEEGAGAITFKVIKQ